MNSFLDKILSVYGKVLGIIFFLLSIIGIILSFIIAGNPLSTVLILVSFFMAILGGGCYFYNDN